MIIVEHFRQMSRAISAALVAFGVDLDSALHWPDLFLDCSIIILYWIASCFGVA
jgi:hypothetical protein